jgi:hypothetical protein
MDPTSVVRINWRDICSSCAQDYFSSYSRYIRVSKAMPSGDFGNLMLYVHTSQVDICADTDEHHRFWFGWCESKLRQFLLSIEKVA